MADAGLIIEAATEREDIKRKIFESVGAVLGQQAVFWRDDSMIVLTLNKDNRVTSNAVRFDPLSVVSKSIANSTRSSTEVFIGAKSGLINHGYKQVD
jgi:hypothetical protein